MPIAGDMAFEITFWDPFAFIAEKTKGFVVPVIISAVMVMRSAAYWGITNRGISHCSGGVYIFSCSSMFGLSIHLYMRNVRILVLVKQPK